MKKLKRTYRRCALVVLAVLVILMVVGSFLDLQISKLLYPGHESSLGQFFAAFGELPAFLCFTCAGVLLFLIRGRLRRDWNVLFLIISALLVAFGLVMNIREACDNVPALPAWVAILVTVFAAAVAGAGVVLLTRQCPAKTVLRFLLTLVFVSFVTMVLINVIKIPWSRARMRLLVSTGNDTYFMPWWQLGGALKQRLVGEGISPDEFRYFIGQEMRLEQVSLRKTDLVKDLLEFYMGKNTMERQNFIIQNLVVEEDLVREEDAQ